MRLSTLCKQCFEDNKSSFTNDHEMMGIFIKNCTVFVVIIFFFWNVIEDSQSTLYNYPCIIFGAYFIYVYSWLFHPCVIFHTRGIEKL